MIIKKTCIDHSLAHECPKYQIFAWRSANNKETDIMDKLLTHPFTLHETLHFQAPLGLFFPALASITDWHPISSFLWPVGPDLYPLVTPPNEPFQPFLQSVPQAWVGLTVNKRNPFHCQFSNPSLQAPFCSGDYGTLDAVNVCGPKL